MNLATSAGMCDRIIQMAHWATNNPRTAPPAESMTLSVSNWRTTRQRVPPSAARTANSLFRLVMRANCTLATAAQAMSKTKATAPISKSVYWRVIVPVMKRGRGMIEHPAFVRIGIGFGLALLYAAHFRGSTLEGDAGFQPAENPEPTAVAALTIFGFDIERKPGLGGHGEIKALAHDPDDGKVFAVNLDVFSDDTRIGSVALLPKRVAEDNLLTFAGLFLAWCEPAP